MLTHTSRFAGFSRLHLLTGIIFLVISGAATLLVAGDHVPASAPASSLPAAESKQVAAADVTLARAVLIAVDADPVLKDVNFLISVVDRGAVIAGPVASEAIKQRAEAVVRGVPGIVSVKNTCFVAAEPDPLLRAIADRMKTEPKELKAPTLPGVALAPSIPDRYVPPMPTHVPTDLLAAPPNTSTVVAAKPTIPVGPTLGVLGAPVSPAAPGRVQVAPHTDSPGSLTGSPMIARPADVQTAVAAIRANNTRFAKLEVEVKPDGGVLITGWSSKAADAWDFAAEVRKIPGVIRVAVDPNLVK